VALCDWIASVAGEPHTVAVAIEVPHGPVVDALLDRGFAVRAINPKQLDRLRDRFSVAGAKDDRRDARVAASGLRTDSHLFRPVLAAPMNCSRSACAWPTASASSSGATTHSCSSSATAMSRPSGSWRCGAWRRPRPRQPGRAQAR
jgi:hypothetical protein